MQARVVGWEAKDCGLEKQTGCASECGGLGKLGRWIGKAKKVGRESEYGGLCKRGRWIVKAREVDCESE